MAALRWLEEKQLEDGHECLLRHESGSSVVCRSGGFIMVQLFHSVYFRAFWVSC